MGNLKRWVMGAAVAAAGVVLAGFLLKWGYDNDIPILKDAANGFDS